ncbi:MAG: MSMEG_0567/sll0787 family protein [Actinomycetota bacterium]
MSRAPIGHSDGAASDVLVELGGPRRAAGAEFLIEVATDDALGAYHELRRAHFVDRQGLFAATDLDDIDGHPDTTVLVARSSHAADVNSVLGGVRVYPVGDPSDGWWVGGRLVVDSNLRGGGATGVGAALVRAACSFVESEGAIRFDASVQPDKEAFFASLGWQRSGLVELHRAQHVLMRWPFSGFARQAAHKGAIGRLVGDIGPGGDRWVGDDGAPTPGTDVIAVNDAILPAMVERDPWWAGWCSVLVNINDLTAMGAAPVGLLDSIGAPTESLAHRVIAGMTDASRAWGVDIMGGHTQLGVHPALSVTMLGRTERPIPGGGARPGQRLTLIADLGGHWRPGYTGRQWDSTSSRTPEELQSMQRSIADLTPAAAKDVSMAGIVGTIAMLAEASGVSIDIDVTSIPRPAGARLGEWLTCFPGYAMVVAHDEPISSEWLRRCQPATVAEIGRVGGGRGVHLVWPDGYAEQVVGGAVTGLGPAHSVRAEEVCYD